MKKIFPILIGVLTAITATCGGEHSSVNCGDKTLNPKDGTIVNMIMPKSNLYVAPIKPIQTQRIFRTDTLSRAVRF